MGLFSGKSKEQKEKEAKAATKAAWTKIYNDLKSASLLFYEQSDEELKNQNLLSLHKLLANRKMAHLSESPLVAFGISQSELRMSAISLSIATQNWILIRQNEVITRLLRKICSREGHIKEGVAAEKG